MAGDLRRFLGLALARWRGGLTPPQAAALMYLRIGTSRDFHRTTLQALALGGWAPAQCVFVLSTGRAGSMQLTAVLAKSPRLLALHEPAPSLLHIGARAYAERCEGRHWRDTVHAARDEFVAFAHHEGRVYVETNNRLTYLAPALAEAFPSSRFIHMHRDPWAIIRSGLSRGWFSGGGVDFSLPRPRPDDPLSARWEQMSAVEKIGWFWARINEDSMRFLAQLPPERRLTLAASDFFAARPEVMAALFAFVGADQPPMADIQAALRRQLNATPAASAVRAATGDSIDREAVRHIVAPVAAQLGYSC